MRFILYKLLLVESDVVNTQLIKKLLSQTDKSTLGEDLSFDLTCCQSLKDAVKILDYSQFDVILLDLILSDCQGVECLLRLKQKTLTTPIIVQAANDDETLIVKAFQKGADGYLRKKDLDGNLLIYAIRLAIERQQYINNRQSLEKQEQQQIELQTLENFANSTKTSVNANMFASQTIKESLPDIFSELVQNYQQLLDLALEEKTFRVEYEISKKLSFLAEKLGFLKASPRDVIDIHTLALKEKSKDVNITKFQAYVDEGRLRLLELMGYLTSYYRKYYIGLSNSSIYPDESTLDP